MNKLKSDFKSLDIRFRGQVGIADDGQGHDGKWFTEISMWTHNAKKMIGSLGTFGPYDTNKEAEDKCVDLCKLAVKFVTKELMGQDTDYCFDMLKKGKLTRLKDL